jgi:hypothetical protein
VYLGFQPLSPNIDIAFLVASSLTESSHTQTKVDHATQYVEPIQRLQHVHGILPWETYKKEIYFNKERNSPWFIFNRSFVRFLTEHNKIYLGERKIIHTSNHTLRHKIILEEWKVGKNQPNNRSIINPDLNCLAK